MGGSSFSSDQSVAHATGTAQMVAVGGTGKIEIWDNGDGVPYIGRWTHEDIQPTAEQLEG